MNSLTLTKDGVTIVFTATTSSDKGLLSQLMCSGCYSEDEAFDVCLRSKTLAIEYI